MNKAVKITFIIIIILAVIAFVIAMIVVATKNKNKKTLNYYTKYSNIYSFVENKNNYEIVIKQQFKCNKAPCNPHVVETKKINDKEDCDMLKSLFDEIFKNNKEKEKTVRDENLTEEQLEIIIDILEKYANFSELKYEIIKDDNDYYNSTYSEKVYSYIIQNETAIYTISLGQKPDSCYSIDISKIEINENSAKIFVEEGLPDKGESCLDAIVYPTIHVKFSKIPKYVSVINEKTGENFSEVKIKLS